jgi:hypothetical protein
MPLAAPVELPRFVAWPALPVLIVILFASVVTYRLLVVRWTTRKHWLDLSRWADEHAMSLHGPERAALPDPLATLSMAAPDAVLVPKSAANAPVTLASFHTPHAKRTDTSQFTQWHVLVRPLAADWPATALRPRANASSLVDLFPQMTSFPSMAPPERFVIFGADSAAARRVAKSSLLALLPPDLGLILQGRVLLLDFSARPFDSIELTRITTLVEQLVTHLPAPPT